MGGYLTADDMETIGSPQYKDVAIESLGGKLVRLRSLTSLEVLKFYKSVRERADLGLDEHHIASFLSVALCKEDGSPLFDSMASGMDKLMKLPHVALIEMYAVADELNPMSVKAIEERAKNQRQRLRVDLNALPKVRM